MTVSGPQRPARGSEIGISFREILQSGGPPRMAVEEEQVAEVRVAQIPGRVEDGIEHRLELPGDALMTPRISDVAVCRSKSLSSSRVRAWTSSNSRVFSIAITAWSAKVSTSSTCLSPNGRTSARRMRIAPMASPPRRGARRARCATRSAARAHDPPGTRPRSACTSATWIGLPLNDGAAANSSTHERPRVFPDRSREGDLSMMGGKAKNIALHLKDRGVVGIAQARCRLDKRIEDTLHVERRAADDFEHVAGCGLLLKGFTQLVEQPRVLDGDDGLVGESLQELHLLIRERPGFVAHDTDDANRSTAAHHGHHRHCPVAAGKEVARPGYELGRRVSDVGDVHNSAVENGEAVHVLAREREREFVPPGLR